VLTTGAAALFAAGRAFGAIGVVGVVSIFASPLIALGLRYALPKVGLALSKANDFQIAAFLAVFVAAVASRLIEWSLWHSASFTFAVAMLVYFIWISMGAEVSVRLDTPSVGLPLIMAFLTMLWWAHFGPYGDARLVTMVMAVLAFAPFVSLTFFNAVGLS
jgi:hypothetical protein